MLRTVRVLTVLLLPVSHAAAFDVLVGEILREAPDRIVQTEWGGVAVDSQRWGVVSTAGVTRGVLASRRPMGSA